MDPVSGWPFFVNHPNRLTTWHDPRLSSTCRPWALADPQPNFFSPFPVSSTNDFFRPVDRRPKPRHSHQKPRHSSGVAKPADTKQPAQVSPLTSSGVHVEYPKLEGLSLEPVTPEEPGVHESLKSSEREKQPAEQEMTAEQEKQCEERPQPEVEAQLTRIRDIAAQVESLEKEVASFSGEVGSTRYIFLEESLMSQLLALDSTQTFGLQQIRSARKKVTTDIQNLLAQLESVAVS
jgi:BCL2-associated athanogene 3